MIKFLIAIFLAGVVSAASGQVRSVDSTGIRKSYWIAGRVGLSTLGSVSGMLVANAEIKNHILISASTTGETNGILDFSATHSVDVSSFNMLAGKIYKQRHSLISFSAGLGLVKIDTHDSEPGIFGKVYPESSETTIGIPLLIQAYAIGFQTIGVGLNLYGNLNTKQSTAGIQVCLALGRIATRPRH
jgi:hypothetical protein